MKIETERLTLIPSNNDSIDMMERQNYNNGPQTLTHIERLSKDPTLYGWGSWLVVRKTDGVIVGDVGFKGRPNSKREVEIGYGLLETYWRTGYATEAVESLVKWAFESSMVEKVKAETTVKNYGSIRVLQKTGMNQVEKTDEMIYWELMSPSC